MTVRINEDCSPLSIEEYEGQITDDEAAGGVLQRRGIAIPEGAHEYIQNMEFREQRGAA